MSDIVPFLPEKARATDARARLTGSVGALQARLAPKALAQSAVQGLIGKGEAAAHSGVDIARKNPGAVAGAIAAIGLFFARKPIARLITRRSATPALDTSKPRIRAVRRNAE